MVLANVGAALLPAMAAISLRLTAKPRSNAGTKCSMAMRSNGGISNGVCQGASRGFSPFNATFASVFRVFAAAVFGFLPAVCGLFFIIVDALAHAFVQAL